MDTRHATSFIVVHCAATRPELDIGAAQIREWHRRKGWSDIGYHYVIRRSGMLESGRNESLVGAHVKGYNHTSVGICLVGGVNADNDPDFNYTREQMATLEDLIAALLERYPGALVWGHRDFPDVNKACPCFDVQAWWTG